MECIQADKLLSICGLPMYDLTFLTHELVGYFCHNAGFELLDKLKSRFLERYSSKINR